MTAPGRSRATGPTAGRAADPQARPRALSRTGPAARATTRTTDLAHERNVLVTGRARATTDSGGQH